MKPLERSVIGILGLGLMGGAFARSLSALSPRPGRILGCDTCEESLAAAAEDGFIDQGFIRAEELLPQADLVFLCLSPQGILRFMEARMEDFKSGALITDIAGIKGAVAAVVEKTLRADLDFIPGHPMTGGEKGGYANSKSCNFQGKNYILTPLKGNRRENLDYLRALILRLGFARITETTAEDHDRKIAFTSQLCHVIAAALIGCDPGPEIVRFGGGSFEDLTRIALLNAPLWTELFLENRTTLLDQISRFETSLGGLKSLIAASRQEELLEALLQVREKRSAMK